MQRLGRVVFKKDIAICKSNYKNMIQEKGKEQQQQAIKTYTFINKK